MEVIQGGFGKPKDNSPSNEPLVTNNPALSERLRALADANDKNELEGIVFCAVEEGQHTFYMSANLYMSIALSQLLNKVIMDHFTTHSGEL